ncbi:hypothetical protein pkur_cds_728 [Pandoravirus kuranda]|uniref:Uncharacterized protein n=1 Tax=Pandoravirus kuranda TaxID=3019033 RepID=A0AA95EDN9_9VIRU|nr:hypothetical protein pkur_cds_728 [Pandoravirus kuranda]
MASRKGSLIRGWRAMTSDVATKRNRMHNPTDAIKAAFVHEGDPAAIGVRAYQEMVSQDGDGEIVGGRQCSAAGTGRRARKKVAIACQRAVKMHPPRFYHRVPLWGIYVAPFFYSLYLDPAADMVARGGCVTHVTMASHGIQTVGIVGETSLDHSDVFDVVRRVASALGADDGPHTLYWNAVDFLKATAEALCAGNGGCTWEAIALDEAAVRAGLFAAVPNARYDAKDAHDVPADRRHRRGSAIACPRTRSAACIRAHWPDVIDPERDAAQGPCLLA